MGQSRAEQSRQCQICSFVPLPNFIRENDGVERGSGPRMRILVCRLPSAGEMFLLRRQKSLEHEPFGEEFNCPLAKKTVSQN